MKHILFVCTGNSCRSVMAEGLFRKYVQDRGDEFEIASAGISAVDGFPASEETIRVMQEEEDIDMSDHRSQRLTMDMVRSADHIFVMERFHKDWITNLMPSAANKVSLLTESSNSHRPFGEIDIPDPIRMSEHFYKNILLVIRDCIKKIVEELGK